MHVLVCTVSVILPFKNAEAHLARAVESIQNQSTADWELILVDDGSTDHSYRIARSYARSDARIRSFTNQNPGIAQALNHGIAQAQGRFIARMDADDVSLPSRLQKQLRFLENNPEIGLVATQVHFLGDRDTRQGYAQYVDWTNQLLSWEDIRSHRFIESPLAHPSVMFRRKLISPGPGPYRQGDFPEDYELWLRWMETGVVMAKLDQPLLDWYDSEDRLSRKDARYSPDSFYKIKARYLAHWLKQEAHTERPIWLWGAGRITRKRTRHLIERGIAFSGYIDIDPRKAGTQLQAAPVIRPEQLDLSKHPFVISYVGNRGAREHIRAFLQSRGLTQERDFILAA